MTDVTDKPVVSEDMQAAFLAAISRAESVRVGETLIEQISDEEWNSDECDDWNITAGADENLEEIDLLDAEVVTAA